MLRQTRTEARRDRDAWVMNPKDNEWKGKAKSISDSIARDAHLTRPIPEGVDFQKERVEHVVKQLTDLVILGTSHGLDVWSRFCADHLANLVARFLAFDKKRQINASRLYLFMLGAIDSDTLYLKKFLRNPAACKGLPKAAVLFFFQDPELQVPSNAAHLAELFIQFIYHCNDPDNGDERACIDKSLRTELAGRMMVLMAPPLDEFFLETQRAFMERLVGLLGAVESIVGHVRRTQKSLKERDVECANLDCMTGQQEASVACSRCRTVVYCNQECQKADWEVIHKYRCFQVGY